MKRKQHQRTSEEMAQLNAVNLRQFQLVSAVVWSVMTVACLVLLYLDVTNDASPAQMVLHGVCAVATAVAAVINFRRRFGSVKKEDSGETELPAEQDTP